MEANTATGERAKTLRNTSSPTGDAGMAGATSAKRMMAMEKKEAKIPAVTIWFAFFFP